jgi:hypothetical protein
MLPSLKKSSDKPSVLVPAWHPNFRNTERLPDTKVVRTSFFTNGLAISIATALVIYTGYREYGLRELKSDTETAVNAITANKPASDQALDLFKKFQEQEKQIFALRDFLSESKTSVSNLILTIGGGLPAAISLNSIEYGANAVVLRGKIEGASDEASGRAVAYVEALRKDAALIKTFDDVLLTNIARDAGTGQIRFQIDMKLKKAVTKSRGNK